MKWHIPAKTFLLGEYAAICGASAIVLTTSPCFSMEISGGEKGPSLLHPDSPAGRLRASQSTFKESLIWDDPYCGQGGLGASSAQFLGVYLANCHLKGITPEHNAMLETYFQFAWQGQGLRPSGYDVLAQSLNQCVYINRQKGNIECYDWAFKDISFLLVHTGQKLATHDHLKTMALPHSSHINELSDIVEQAKQAFDQRDSEKLIDAINAYQGMLTALNLTAKQSLEKVDYLRLNPNIFAAKGCGAMGADVLLLIIKSDALKSEEKNLVAKGFITLASNDSLYRENALFKNNHQKKLEILL